MKILSTPFIMKALTAIVITVLFLQAKGYLIKVPTSPIGNRIEPAGWVHIQKLLMPLFENVCEESSDPVVLRLSEEFLTETESSDFLKPEVFEKFHSLILNKSLLPKGEIFTELNKDHYSELQIVSEVFLYAKDFDTFYKAACWARQNVNCGLFVDAIYIAIINRRDTERLYLPALFEVLPNYFIQKDYILKASSLASGEEVSSVDGVRVEGNSYIVDVNYTTDSYDEINDDLNYFHEDIGLNTYYYLMKLKSIQWYQNATQQDSKWGQYLYNNIKNLVNRYNLERYSNGLSELEPINWDNINELLYDPKLIYSNGNEFVKRLTVNTNDPILSLLKNIESNLSTIVTNMRDQGYEKSDILNHLMEVLVTSETSYENLALQILSNIGTASSSYSALSHFMTTVRDPVFWRLNKKIVEMVDDALKLLPAYTKNQLYFPGVQIMSVDVKKLSTNFENFQFDITDALKTQKSNSKFQIKINQNRLSRKPFSMKINISSLVAQKGLIKIYIGPKVMPGEFIEKKNLFMLLDCFEVNIKIGSNIITRTSNQINNLSEDFLSLQTIRKHVLDAEFGIDTIPLHLVQSQINFPSRLVLPKGTNEGMPLQMFVFIAPFVKATIVGSQNSFGTKANAILSPGYPLDLEIDNENNILLDLPNALCKDIVITHKSTMKTNSYNGEDKNYNDWQNTNSDDAYPKTYLQSSKPQYSNKSFDYKSKQAKFGKKQDYPKKHTVQSLDNDKHIYESEEKNTNNKILDDISSQTITNILRDHNTEDFIESSIFKNSDIDDNSNKIIFKNDLSNEENISGEKNSNEPTNTIAEDHEDIENDINFTNMEKNYNTDRYKILNGNSGLSHNNEIYESNKSDEVVQDVYKSLPNLLAPRKEDLFKVYNIIFKPNGPEMKPDNKPIVYV